MSRFKIYGRAFHPDKNFGLGGLGFKGDDRGFSFMVNDVSSRVWSRFTVDTQNPTKYAVSPPPKEDFQVFSDLSIAPIYLGGRSEKYTSTDTLPSGEARSAGGPHVPDGLQNITVDIKTTGINHAFPTEYLADLRRLLQIDDLYEALGGGDIPMNPETRMLVPSLDIQLGVTLLIDRHKKKIRITSNLMGDGFPNAEVFIVDGAETPVMLNTHHRIGSAASQLIGNHGHLLAATIITIGIDDHDNFVGPIEAQRCVDFMPWDTDILTIAMTTEFALYEWNGIHVARAATETGIFGFDTDDALPFGQDHRWPRDRRDSGKISKLFKEPTLSDLPHWDH